MCPQAVGPSDLQIKQCQAEQLAKLPFSPLAVLIMLQSAMRHCPVGLCALPWLQPPHFLSFVKSAFCLAVYCWIRPSSLHL